MPAPGLTESVGLGELSAELERVSPRGGLCCSVVALTFFYGDLIVFIKFIALDQCCGWCTAGGWDMLRSGERKSGMIVLCGATMMVPPGASLLDNLPVKTQQVCSPSWTLTPCFQRCFPPCFMNWLGRFSGPTNFSFVVHHVNIPHFGRPPFCDLTISGFFEYYVSSRYFINMMIMDKIHISIWLLYPC
jgi:hypothetical protein